MDKSELEEVVSEWSLQPDYKASTAHQAADETASTAGDSVRTSGSASQRSSSPPAVADESVAEPVAVGFFSLWASKGVAADPSSLLRLH